MGSFVTGSGIKTYTGSGGQDLDLFLIQASRKWTNTYFELPVLPSLHKSYTLLQPIKTLTPPNFLNH